MQGQLHITAKLYCRKGVGGTAVRWGVGGGLRGGVGGGGSRGGAGAY